MDPRSARAELVYRLSPLRAAASKTGFGLPTPHMSRSSSGSYDPVSHVGAPPSRPELPAHVSPPGSPGLGIVVKRHPSLPLFAQSAEMKPCAPRTLSGVATPVQTRSR